MGRRANSKAPESGGRSNSGPSPILATSTVNTSRNSVAGERGTGASIGLGAVTQGQSAASATISSA